MILRNITRILSGWIILGIIVEHSPVFKYVSETEVVLIRIQNVVSINLFQDCSKLARRAVFDTIINNVYEDRVRRQTGETTYCIYRDPFVFFGLNWAEIDQVYYITEPLWVHCSVSRKLDRYSRLERQWRHARSTEFFETIEIHPEFLPLPTLSRLNIIFVANLSDYTTFFY